MAHSNVNYRPPRKLIMSPAKRVGFMSATVVLGVAAVGGCISLYGYAKGKIEKLEEKSIKLEQLYSKIAILRTSDSKDLFVSGIIGSVLGSIVFITARMFIPRKAYVLRVLLLFFQDGYASTSWKPFHSLFTSLRQCHDTCDCQRATHKRNCRMTVQSVHTSMLILYFARDQECSTSWTKTFWQTKRL